MPMTDELLGPQRVSELGRILADADPAAAQHSMSAVARSLDGLALSARARLLAVAIRDDHGRTPEALNALVRAALDDPDFTGWMLWPAGLAVAWSAVEHDTHEALDNALDVLRELTPRMSSEFSIRPLLRHDLDRSLGHLSEWTTHSSWHVRRLASEGSRPLLPWAERIPALVADPTPSRPILDALFDDPEESVRRSVANHLNDHSRAHERFTVDTVRGWQRRGGTHVDRTTRHALRTLVKRGDPGALDVLGFGSAQLTVSALRLESVRVPIGGEVRFAADITNVGATSARLVIDYVLAFPDARGRERVKVFKLAQRELAPGTSTTVATAQSFRLITTRTYYPGTAAIALQINGVVQDRAVFELGAA